MIEIAFIGWNPFQFNHVSVLLRAIPSSKFIIECRNDGQNLLDLELLEEFGDRVIRLPKNKVIEVDGEFDVIVCQTLFDGIEKIKNTKIVMIQYGYAKEPHNYGTWRALADLNLTYGNYAKSRILPFSPTVSIGNPNYDIWENPNYKLTVYKKYSEILDSKKKTILYAPTWGELSSIDAYGNAITKLAYKYNVLIKLHHNTSVFKHKRSSSDVFESCIVFSEYSDILELLAVSDVLISDYSGAIFDALYFRKPIVLLSNPNALHSSKLDEHSLEYSRRLDIGTVVESASGLEQGINKALSLQVPYTDVQESLRLHLFSQSRNTAANFLLEIDKLLNKKYALSQSQKYIRKTVKENIDLVSKNRDLKTRNRPLSLKLRRKLIVSITNLLNKSKH